MINTDKQTSGDKIKSVRQNRCLTQKQLAEKSGVLETTIRKYEIGVQKPKLDNLTKIASALGVDVTMLMPNAHAVQVLYGELWGYDLEEKLKQIGYSIGFYEEDAYLWINYPDGTLEISENELKELNDSANSFLRFKLEELKEKHKTDFKPKK